MRQVGRAGAGTRGGGRDPGERACQRMDGALAARNIFGRWRVSTTAAREATHSVELASSSRRADGRASASALRTVSRKMLLV